MITTTATITVDVNELSQLASLTCEAIWEAYLSHQDNKDEGRECCLWYLPALRTLIQMLKESGCDEHYIENARSLQGCLQTKLGDFYASIPIV